MIEAAARELPEATLADALRFAHAAVGDLIDAQRALAEQIGASRAAAATASAPPTTVDGDDTDESGAAAAAATTAELAAARQSLERAAASAAGFERARALFSDASLTKAARGRRQTLLQNDMIAAVLEASPESDRTAAAAATEVRGERRERGGRGEREGREQPRSDAVTATQPSIVIAPPCREPHGHARKTLEERYSLFDATTSGPGRRRHSPAA